MAAPRALLTRSAISVPAGLLYYSQMNSILRVEAKVNEIRALILARNELASHLAQKRTVATSSTFDHPRGSAGVLQGDFDVSNARESPVKDDLNLEDIPFLPPSIDNPKECRTCYAVDSCMLYRKVRFIVNEIRTTSCIG